MKRLLLLFIIGILSCTLSAQSSIDTDKGATAILKSATAKYNSYSTITVKFTVKNLKDKKTIDSFQGNFYIKSNKYKVIMKDQSMFCDGTTIWNYQVESNEVSIFAYSEGDEPMFHPTKILNEWEKEYNSQFIRETTENGKVLQIIDLMPIKSQSYYKIRLFLNKAQKQIVRSEIFMKDNSTYTCYIDTFTPNLTIDDSNFTFQASQYPNVLINDMR